LAGVEVPSACGVHDLPAIRRWIPLHYTYDLNRVGTDPAGGEPLPDEGSVGERLAKVERWLEGVVSGSSSNGADGWWYIPGKGGWVIRG
jgi:hypothetical protein